MLVEAWQHLEGRIRVAIMNGEAWQAPAMMARDRHAPIVDAIERGDARPLCTWSSEHMASAAERLRPVARIRLDRLTVAQRRASFPAVRGGPRAA